MDNQSNKGIESDTSPGRHKPKGKRRKNYLIEWRMIPPPNPKSVVYQFPRFGGWTIWGRYETAARREQALASLVKKTEQAIWGRTIFRRVDP